MSRHHFEEVCDDPDCVLCQDDDADAAFWDEFFATRERGEAGQKGGSYTITIVDEDTGEEQVYRGISLKEKKTKLID